MSEIRFKFNLDSWDVDADLDLSKLTPAQRQFVRDEDLSHWRGARPGPEFDRAETMLYALRGKHANKPNPFAVDLRQAAPAAIVVDETPAYPVENGRSVAPRWAVSTDALVTGLRAPGAPHHALSAQPGAAL